MKSALKGGQVAGARGRPGPRKGDRASAKVDTTAAKPPPSADTVARGKEGGNRQIGALAGG